ncbi:MAG: xanthine phosphoribosyltransferase [Saccharofermentanales bacterium]
MELLKQKILEEGIVINNDVLKVDSFLNHCMDARFMHEIGKEFARRFRSDHITRILTVETSGIAPAIFTGLELDVPVVFAKKSSSLNMDKEVYETGIHSFTRQRDFIIRVSRKYLGSGDTVLIIDDFLANGQAVIGMAELISMAGARLAGAGIVIEKGFQDGGALIRGMGIRVESLAIIDRMSEGKIIFRNEEENKK